jgi:hypothetical protein
VLEGRPEEVLNCCQLRLPGSDCKRLRASSVVVRNWIMDQPEVREESITDWLLYDLRRRIPHIRSVVFNHSEEARKTGADWEWWFLFQDLNVKMRVQAKKLRAGRNNYSSLAYTNAHGLQIEKLLEDSRANNSLPFYAFYTSLSETVMCPQNVNDEGVFLAGGNRIYTDFVKYRSRTVSTSDVMTRCVGLSCFLCCPTQDSSGHEFVGFLNSHYRREFRRERGEGPRGSGELRGVHNELPGYVLHLIEHPDQGNTGDWDRNFGRDTAAINALLVYDVRN